MYFLKIYLATLEVPKIKKQKLLDVVIQFSTLAEQSPYTKNPLYFYILAMRKWNSNENYTDNIIIVPTTLKYLGTSLTK